jgi:hypothetical protein
MISVYQGLVDPNDPCASMLVIAFNPFRNGASKFPQRRNMGLDCVEDVDFEFLQRFAGRIASGKFLNFGPEA